MERREGKRRVRRKNNSHLEREELVLESSLDVQPPSGIEVEELLDEVAEPALDHVGRRDDLLEREKEREEGEGQRGRRRRKRKKIATNLEILHSLQELLRSLVRLSVRVVQLAALEHLSLRPPVRTKGKISVELETRRDGKERGTNAAFLKKSMGIFPITISIIARCSRFP